ncbi:hypothetical protein Nepgr_009465 [Nepenthes gracilis]|uniref:Secreted protein n=1 Tax=Nepenthes gracilis TaxID=150966 RepID=A0AAD3SAM6_NEPGR|nr:hypothetical protein Nepgr_009465 [Nepenthes gracilis]
MRIIYCNILSLHFLPLRLFLTRTVCMIGVTLSGGDVGFVVRRIVWGIEILNLRRKCESERFRQESEVVGVK